MGLNFFFLSEIKIIGTNFKQDKETCSKNSSILSPASEVQSHLGMKGPRQHCRGRGSLESGS